MKNNKIMSFLLSLTIAFGLWLYVVSFVSSEHTDTVAGIPVYFEGETVLTERNLMITAGKNATVSLTLTGSRSDMSKVDKNNISIKVDLTKVYDPGEHQLQYTPVFPSDVPNDAFNVQARYPGTINITVETIARKEVPVNVIYSGSAPEGFLTDRENAVLDYPYINVTGPSSVVELIDHAEISVDLEGRNESISESYRYTLVDAESNPVNVEQVTTNVAEVRLDMKIQRFEEIPLRVTANYGGGATEKSAQIEIQPATIRVSGSEALLAELTEINLGMIDLTTLTSDTTMTFPINLPEGVTNLSELTEATVKITFTGLTIKEFTVNQIKAINVPEGMEYDLLNDVLKVTLRGPTELIYKIVPEDIVVTVDLAGTEVGTTTVKATITINGDQYADIGAMGGHTVSVTIREKEVVE